MNDRRIEDSLRQGDELCALLQESEDARVALEGEHASLAGEHRALQLAFEELTVEVTAPASSNPILTLILIVTLTK